MKFFEKPYSCPKCRASLNVQWDFDPALDVWKCEECGTYLTHRREEAPYVLYYGDPIPGKTLEVGDMDDDFYDSPSDHGDGKSGQQKAPSLGPNAADDIVKEDQERGQQAIARYQSVLNAGSDVFAEADGESEYTDEYDDVVIDEETDGQDKLSVATQALAVLRGDREPDPTRKKGFIWPWGKKAEDTEAGFSEEEIPEEVDWEDESEEKEPGKEKAAGAGTFARKFGKKAKKESPEGTEKKKAGIGGVFRWVKKHYKICCGIVAVIACLIVGSVVYHQISKMRAVTFTDETAVTLTYEEVVELLERAGFENIETIPLEDLASKHMSKENIVDMITINGESDFEEKDRFAYDCEIVIQYHSAKMIKMPLDPKQVKEKTVSELQNLLEKAGFENIVAEADYDLIVGILHKEGEVEKMTVNGREKFTEMQAYRIDTEIVITYHDFKKNQTSK